jgi:hypothetical protein
MLSRASAALLELRRTRGRLAQVAAFTVLSAGTLAPGMGAPTAKLTIADQVVLRPLPCP